MQAVNQDNMFLIEQLKSSKQNLVEKMNEINEMEENVKKQKKILENEQLLFKNREKDLNENKAKFKNIVYQAQSSDRRNSNIEINPIDLGIWKNLN